MPPPTAVHHVTLTVTDVEASADWYASVLGLVRAVERDEAEFRRIVLRSPSGLMLGLTAHHGTPEGDRFDERRVGLDHLALACRDADELAEWAAHLDRLGVAHNGVVDAGFARVVVCRDPDGVPLEFYAPR